MNFSLKSIFGSVFSTGTSVVTELPYRVCSRSEWYKLSIPLIWIPNQIFIFCVCEFASFCHLALKTHQNIPGKADLSPRLGFPQKSSIVWVKATWRLPQEIKCCAYQRMSYMTSFSKDPLVLPPGTLWLMTSYQDQSSPCTHGLWQGLCSGDLGVHGFWRSSSSGNEDFLSKGHASDFKSACSC